MQQDGDAEGPLTTADVAALTGRSQSAVRSAIFATQLRSVRIDGRRYITREDALSWNASSRPSGRSSRSQSWEQAARLLAEYPSLSAEELAELADIHVGNARKHLAILAKQGRAVRRSDGQWVLTSSSHQEVGLAAG